MAGRIGIEQQRYGTAAIVFHWLIAAAIFLQLWIGFTVHAMDKGSFQRFQALQWHKSVGVTILLLSLARLAWRLFNPPPPPPGHLRPLEQTLARLAHYGLYALTIAVPLAGWATVSASPLGLPTKLYGVVDWPHIPFLASAANQEATEHLMYGIHQFLVFALIGLFLVHILAALRHHFLLRDDVAARMIPWLANRDRGSPDHGDAGE